MQIVIEDQLAFITPLKDQEVVEGEQAEFVIETNVTSRKTTWYKSGREVRPVLGSIEIKENKTKFRLVIKKATKEDTAEYKVNYYKVK